MTMLTKQPDETLPFAIDFINKIPSGDSLNSITSVSSNPTGLIITNQTIYGTQVAFDVAGGASGTLYTITAGVATTAGYKLKGEGGLYVAALAYSASATAYTYSRLKQETADFLGWARNSSDWTADEQDRLDSIIKSALTQVYYPISTSQAGTVHQWSWMRPVSRFTTSEPYSTGTVQIADGVVTLTDGTWPSWAAQGELIVNGRHYPVNTRDDDTQITLHDTSVDVDSGTDYTLARYLYDLPADFEGLEGDLNFLPSQAELYPPLDVVSDSMIRRHRHQWPLKDKPRYASIRPKSFDPTLGQRWEMALYPTPDGAYDIEYRYRIAPGMLSDTNEYPHGGDVIGELILQACLAVAENRYRDQAGHHTQLFQQRLAAAVANDAQSFSPDTLGYNSDNSERRYRGIHDGTPIHSFEGVVYYDRNP